MRQYGVFHPLFMAFYSKPLYRDVGANWKGGAAFLYLLALLALAWVPVMIDLHVDTGEAIAREAPKIINQIPVITITKGQASVDAPVPYFIVDPDTGTQIVAIDTSGKITSLDQTEAMALLTRSQFMLRQQHREARVYDLSQVESFTLDREKANAWVQAFRKWFAPLAYPFAVAGSYAFRVVQALIYALIAMLFAGIVKTTLDYGALLRLSIVALTPVIILNAVRRVLDVTVPSAGLIGFLIAMIYLYFAVKANAGNGQRQTA